jgi:hypothetical protein
MQSNVAIIDVTTPIVTSTVVKGPWPAITAPAQDETSIQAGVKAVKANHVVEALLTIVPMLFNNLEIAGFSSTATDGLDSTLIIEAIKSLMMKHHGLYHPLQDVAANLFVSADNGEITMADRLDIDLDPCDDTEVIIHSTEEDF